MRKVRVGGGRPGEIGPVDGKILGEIRGNMLFEVVLAYMGIFLKGILLVKNAAVRLKMGFKNDGEFQTVF